MRCERKIVGENFEKRRRRRKQVRNNKKKKKMFGRDSGRKKDVKI
jgi:hypothetical protein